MSEAQLPDNSWRDVVKVAEAAGANARKPNGCYPVGESIREVVDDFISAEEVETLLQMMQKGMASSPQTGSIFCCLARETKHFMTNVVA